MATDTEQIIEMRIRMAKLETNFCHIENQLTDMHIKVNDLHDLLMQAKGARWLIIGMASISGAAAALLAKLIPFAGTLPK